MSYLRYLCLFAHSGVQHILCCGFFFLRGGGVSSSDIIQMLEFFLLTTYLLCLVEVGFFSHKQSAFLWVRTVCPHIHANLFLNKFV